LFQHALEDQVAADGEKTSTATPVVSEVSQISEGQVQKAKGMRKDDQGGSSKTDEVEIVLSPLIQITEDGDAFHFGSKQDR
jgi:hypothetical protein